MKPDPSLTTYMKVNSKWIIDLNVTIQLLEENIGENLCDFGLDNGVSHKDFLDKTQKSTSHLRKTAKGFPWWLRLRVPSAGGLGSIPGQGTRSHMHAATKSSHATTKKPMSRN